ncbi:MAG: DUF116 domain-containing protein [Candidatus Sulfobium sp.]
MTAVRLARGVVLKVFYPVLMLAGSFFRGKKESFQRTVVDLNNKLVRAEGPGMKRILLLLPHCLQIDECTIRLTHNIQNCKRCGRCKISDFIGIAEENGLSLFVATGGNLARKIVRDVRPEAIVAVACERDLSSGLVDTYPIPIIGIPNDRPFGPCLNTQVDLDKVREAIEFFSGSAGQRP